MSEKQLVPMTVVENFATALILLPVAASLFAVFLTASTQVAS